MKETSVVAKILNRPTTKGGTRIMLVTPTFGVFIALGGVLYPEIFTPTVVAAVEALVVAICIAAASSEEKPVVTVQTHRDGNAPPPPEPEPDPEPDPIHEHPPGERPKITQ